jgi:hypothetical protein
MKRTTAPPSRVWPGSHPPLIHLLYPDPFGNGSPPRPERNSVAEAASLQRLGLMMQRKKPFRCRYHRTRAGCGERKGRELSIRRLAVPSVGAPQFVHRREDLAPDRERFQILPPAHFAHPVEDMVLRKCTMLREKPHCSVPDLDRNRHGADVTRLRAGHTPPLHRAAKKYPPGRLGSRQQVCDPIVSDAARLAAPAVVDPRRGPTAKRTAFQVVRTARHTHPILAPVFDEKGCARGPAAMARARSHRRKPLRRCHYSMIGSD